MEVGFRCVTADEPQYIYDMGVRWCRLSLDWPVIQPSPGEFDFSRYESVIEAAAQLGMSITIELYPYRQTFPGDHWTWRGAKGMIPDMRVWGEYVRTVVRRYRDRVHHWEIWCEPNCMSCNPMHFYDTTVYTDVVKTTSGMIRETDDEARIIAGGLWVNVWASAYVKALTEPSMLPYFDAMSWHFYVMAGSRDAIPFAAWKRGIALWMASFRSSLPSDYPIWMTEFGIPTAIDESGALFSSTAGRLAGLTEEEQADWFTEFANTAEAEWDLDKVFFLILRDVADTTGYFGFASGALTPNGRPKLLKDRIAQFQLGKSAESSLEVAAARQSL